LAYPGALPHFVKFEYFAFYDGTEIDPDVKASAKLSVGRASQSGKNYEDYRRRNQKPKGS
jgi:hypothetical protein